MTWPLLEFEVDRLQMSYSIVTKHYFFKHLYSFALIIYVIILLICTNWLKTTSNRKLKDLLYDVMANSNYCVFKKHQERDSTSSP